MMRAERIQRGDGIDRGNDEDTVYSDRPEPTKLRFANRDRPD